MKKENCITLDGRKLNISEIIKFIFDPKVKIQISSSALEKIQTARNYVDKKSANEIIYGVNTGFGPMASHIIDNKSLLKLQENLIRGHAVGMGNAISGDYVLAAMIVRLNTLLRGYSGVSVELVKHIEVFINNRIIPIVPEHGAVGTSGDLVQLAHIALALMGEGEVLFRGKRQLTKTVLRYLNLTPYTLKSKEGLALINGTSMMTGIAALLVNQAEKLINLEVLNSALALEMSNAFTDSFAKKIYELRPHNGQIKIAKSLSTILSSSKLLQNRKKFNLENNKAILLNKVQEIPDDVQDVYSLRCTPQILGPILDSINFAKKIVETEINSVTDNPLVDEENDTFLHGGNFHGDYIAFAVDQMKISLVKLTILSERRVNYFLNNKINKKFPPFINLQIPGITLALQGLQFVATSTTAQNQTLSFPQYVHSIPTNRDNQDVVSMGTDAALITLKVIENAFIVSTIESFTLAQAVDYTKSEKKLSSETKRLYIGIRQIIDPVTIDRNLSPELERLCLGLKNFHFKDIDLF